MKASDTQTGIRSQSTADLLVPTRYYLRLLDQLESRNTTRTQVLRRAGIPGERLQSEWLSLREAAALVEASQALCAEPHLGFALGRSLRPSDHQVIGYALLSSATLADAMRLAARYWRLLTAVYSMSVGSEGEHLILRWKPVAQLPATLERLHGEAIIAGVHQEMSLLMGRPPAGTLWLPAEWLSPGHPYAQLHSTRIQSLDPADSSLIWTLPATVGDQPLRLSDPNGLSRARRRCEQLLAQLTSAGSLSHWIRLMIRQADDHLPKQGELAALLNLSTRSLHRRLHQEGASFRQIALEERIARARALLIQNQLSLTEIALNLGYGDVANFSRAFRQHCGISPARYRRQEQPLPRV